MAVHEKNGRYLVDYYPNGAKGKRRRLILPIGTTEKEAKQTEKELRRSKDYPIISKDDGISRLAKHYYDYIALHLAESTCKDIKSCFDNHVIPYFGNMRVSELSTPLISTFQKLRKIKPNIRNREEKSINRTINKELSYFSAFLSWVESEIGAIPASPLRFRALPYKRPLPDIMPTSEIRAIINAAEEPYKGIIMAIAHLGLRITSARLLKWSDVDWPSMTVVAHGKGNKEIRLPLSDELAEWLKKKKQQNIYNSPWLFPSVLRPKHPIINIRKPIQRAVEKANVKRKVHPHLFRHSAGAHLIESGVDIRTVQEILGHSDIRMTEWYTQVAMKTKREALTKAGHIKPGKM